MTLSERLRELEQATRKHQWMSQTEKLALIDVALAAEARRQALDAMQAARGSEAKAFYCDKAIEHDREITEYLTVLAGVLGGDAS